MSDANVCAPRDNKDQIEEGGQLALKFDASGLIPAVAVDHKSGEVLMVAYMNADSLAMTLEKGEAVYFSRSRQKLWHKGETSGNTQKVHEIRTDCDQDTLVLKVEQIGGACCHNGYRTCFYRRVDDAAARPVTLANTEPGRVFDPKSVYGK